MLTPMLSCAPSVPRALQRQPVQAIYLAVDGLMLALSILYSELTLAEYVPCVLTSCKSEHHGRALALQ
jgi:hypothetical protein